MVMLNGREAIGLGVYREQGKNCINTCRAIEAQMRRLEKEYRNIAVQQDKRPVGTHKKRERGVLSRRLSAASSPCS
jgi:multidrug efflux pump subunit AcrB